MNESCDRCEARAAYFVTRAAARLFFCVECVIKHFVELMDQDWVLWPIGAVAVAPQGNVEEFPLNWTDVLPE